MNFFEFREQIVAREAPTTQPMDSAPLTVSQLTSVIDRAIKGGVPAFVSVKGEVSNFNLHRGSGHMYFTLKDKDSCLDCVIFKSDAQRIKFKPADGMELIAGGRIGVYAQRGRYQLYVTSLNPIGQGALELAFKQLRAKLEAEGLFAQERKKPLPRFPLNIVLVTSRQTAALQDMLKVLRRHPFLKLRVFHVPVQGDGSAELIAGAINSLHQPPFGEPASAGGSTARPDVILLARGGGSLEDLWEFNEECLARAIAASTIPIVTGIGHEVDTSIADLVADYHAHTPTEAAQVVVTHWRTARDGIDAIALRSRRAVVQLINDARQRLMSVERHEIFRRPLDRINQLRQLLDDRQRSLGFAVTRRLQSAESRLQRASSRFGEQHPRHRLKLCTQRLNELQSRINNAVTRIRERQLARVSAMDAQLQALSPQSVLKRGYSMTTIKKTGKIVRSHTQVKTGDRLVTRFADGTVESVAEDQKQLPLFE